MGWLNENFGNINDHLSEEGLMCYAHAFIMRLIRGMLMPDLSGYRVPLRYLILLQDFDAARRYSWGSAVLGYLYHQLCLAMNMDKKDIVGYTVLLHLWAWVRICGLSLDDTGYPILAGRQLGAR